MDLVVHVLLSPLILVHVDDVPISNVQRVDDVPISNTQRVDDVYLTDYFDVAERPASFARDTPASRMTAGIGTLGSRTLGTRTLDTQHIRISNVRTISLVAPPVSHF